MGKGKEEARPLRHEPYRIEIRRKATNERAGLVDLVERAGLEIVAEPEYSGPDPGPALRLLRAAYTALTRSPDHPLLDFGRLPHLRLWKKAALAVLWPFLRLALELDAASAGMRSDRVALIARNRAAPA